MYLNIASSEYIQNESVEMILMKHIPIMKCNWKLVFSPKIDTYSLFVWPIGLTFFCWTWARSMMHSEQLWLQVQGVRGFFGLHVAERFRETQHNIDNSRIRPSLSLFFFVELNNTTHRALMGNYTSRWSWYVITNAGHYFHDGVICCSVSFRLTSLALGQSHVYPVQVSWY